MESVSRDIDRIDDNLRDEGLVAGDVRVARIGGAKRGDPCGVEKRAKGVEPPAGDDDIMR